MKKLLTIAAIALVAGAASAVTMQWGTDAVKFNGSNLKSETKVTGYLIATESLGGPYTLDSSFSASSIGTQVDVKEGTSAMSKISKSWEILEGYGNGDTFAVLLKYDKDGDIYWNLTSALVTMSGMALDPPTDAANTKSAFSFGTGTDGTLTAGGGWAKAKASTPVVPEPATGALALAGIALLFRRRKA